MRIALLGCLVFSGCLSVGFVNARPSLEVDGRHRAIRVVLAPEVRDAFNLSGDSPFAPVNVPVSQWRQSVGQGFVQALGETFVVVAEPAPDVLELEIKEAAPLLLNTQTALFGQITYRALLKTPDGEVLSRAAGVAKAPFPATSPGVLHPMVASAIEELVRQVGNKTLVDIPALFRPTSRTPRTVWYDNLRPASAQVALPASAAAPPPPPPQHACQAEALPEWRTASAAEKKALLERCR
jgi:hypothetical protein